MVGPREMDGPARARLSAPGLRAFRAIAEAWGLSEQQRLRVLGMPARSTYHAWLKKADAPSGLSLPVDTLLRISAVLGVHKALNLLFSREDEARLWLRGPHQGPLFGGQSPLELILAGPQDGILAVRRYLDAWRAGRVAAPYPGLDVAPIGREDLIYG